MSQTEIPIADAPLKARVLDYVLQTDYVSFAELANRFEGFTGGNIVIEMQTNVLLWMNMTQEAATAVRDLVDQGAIVVQPSVPMVYLADGRIPSIPVAKRLRDHKVPHWFPVTLRPPQAKSGARP